MGVDYAHRRKQLKLIEREIAIAAGAACYKFGEKRGRDSHIAYHFFARVLPNGDLAGYLADIDEVLIPNLETSAAWRVLIPDIERTIAPLRKMDPVPRYGCRFCT